ncbi:MAG TPA: peptide-methionine (S)-S-oxide reductase MsrA [Chthoniobacterales bacterium]|jgi:methionine-S-sulfoxide reductase
MKLRSLLLVLALSLAPQLSRAAESKEATFAAGCFWCLEAIFERVPGVTNVVSGYSGGKTANPNYGEVSSGKSGYAEAIELTYDPEKVTYSQLLEIFWRSHDPTDARGVAPDFGPQYRSALFYRTPEEKRAIEQLKVTLEQKLGKPVATQIVPFEKFYPAEDYHQDYVKKNPKDSYVRNVSIPRVIETGFKE